MASKETVPSLALPQGAVLDVLPMRRQLKSYPVDESQLLTLSVANALTAFFFGLAGLAFGFVVNLWVISKTEDTLSSDGESLVSIGVPLVIALAAGFAILGGLAQYFRWSALSGIKKGAVPMFQPGTISPSTPDRPTPPSADKPWVHRESDAEPKP